LLLFSFLPAPLTTPAETRNNIIFFKRQTTKKKSSVSYYIIIFYELKKTTGKEGKSQKYVRVVGSSIPVT